MSHNPSPSQRPDREKSGAPSPTGSYLKRLVPMLIAAFIGSTLLQFLFPELNFVVRLLILAVLLLAVSVVLDRLRSRNR